MCFLQLGASYIIPPAEQQQLQRAVINWKKSQYWLLQHVANLFNRAVWCEAQPLLPSKMEPGENQYLRKRKRCLWMLTQWHQQCSLLGQSLPIPLKLAWQFTPYCFTIKTMWGVPEITLTCSLRQPISGLFIIWRYLIARVIKVITSGRRSELINVDAKWRYLLRKDF